MNHPRLACFSRASHPGLGRIHLLPDCPQMLLPRPKMLVCLPAFLLVVCAGCECGQMS